MLNLKFKQLLVVSHTQSAANRFEFQDKWNLITANDNSVGKSTIAKLLFWTLGCDPELDDTWKNLDCRTLLKFEVGSFTYQVSRYKDIIYLKEANQDFIKYDKITGEYSKRLSEILDFKVLLPNRSTGKLETPPPAYYFLPYYIDQKRSWAEAWNNFDNLLQYANWKSTLVKYHVGLLSSTYFEFEEQITDIKIKTKEIQAQIDRYITTAEIVESYIPTISATIDEVEFATIAEQIREDLNILVSEQEDTLDKLSRYESDKIHLEHQKKLAQNAVTELDADYVFSVENIDGDIIQCPLCGVNHSNSIYNKASILTDKHQVEQQLEAIELSLLSTTKKLSASRIKLEQVRRQIDDINNKYIIQEEKQQLRLPDIINSFASSFLQKNIEKTRLKMAVDAEDLKSRLKKTRKTQKAHNTSEEQVEIIINEFKSVLQDYCRELGALKLNLSNINTPSDYKAVIKEGGAAEGARGILAYYLTVYSLIKKHGSSQVKAPLVIDTPNQQEQTSINYGKIVKLITDKLPKDSQIILCAMENDQVNPYKEKAKIISLDNNKILHESMYESVSKEFTSI